MLRLLETYGRIRDNIIYLTTKESLDNLEVTRLAEGVPIGGEVHYLDENTLNVAYQSRKKIV